MHSIMCCNIRFANPEDGKNDWVNRKEFISELISKNNATLIGTQEGRRPQIIELLKLLPNHTLIESHRDWIEERMYPCLFVNEDLFEIIESSDIWLSTTPDIPGSSSFESTFPRLCTYVLLKEKSSGNKFYVVNCHLDHIKEETRIEQIKVLLAEFSKRNTSLPFILMGDFNSSPTGEVRKVINNNSFKLLDPWQEQGHPEQTSFHKFDGLDPDGSKTRIDWILHTKEICVESIQLIQDHKDGHYPSDHFFVQANFKL